MGVMVSDCVRLRTLAAHEVRTRFQNGHFCFLRPIKREEVYLLI